MYSKRKKKDNHTWFVSQSNSPAYNAEDSRKRIIDTFKKTRLKNYRRQQTKNQELLKCDIWFGKWRV